MKRLLILCLLIVSSPAIGGTTLADFQAISAGWQDTHDMPELLTFLDDWLSHIEPPAPVAHGVAVTASIHELTEFTLTGENHDGYTVTTMPDHGTLYDFWGIRPSGYGDRFTEIRRVPYRVKHGGAAVWYYSDNDTADAFEYRAVRGTVESDSATITITKPVPYVSDSLYFDRTATLLIPHDPNIDFGDAFTFSFYFAPQTRAGTIIRKRGDSGAGIEISLRANNLSIEAWNAAGEYGQVIAQLWPYKDGGYWHNQWQNITLTVGHANPAENNIYHNSVPVASTNGLPTPPYSNTAAVEVGNRYAGKVDKLTWFNAPQEYWPVMFYLGEGRRDYITTDLINTSYNSQFRKDEGGGGITTEHVGGILEGILNGASWTPDNRPRMYRYDY